MYGLNRSEIIGHVGGEPDLTYTEQGAFFDGGEQPADRERGCRELLEALAVELGAQ